MYNTCNKLKNMKFCDKIFLNKEIQQYQIDDYLQQEKYVVMQCIADSINLLLSFAIPGTKVFTMLETMYKFSKGDKQVKEYCLSNPQLMSIEKIKYSSFIFNHVIKGNIPISLCAVAPCFLLQQSTDFDLQSFREELQDFLNKLSKDQARGVVKEMEETLLKSAKMYLSLFNNTNLSDTSANVVLSSSTISM